MYQKTLNRPVFTEGIGLHSGTLVKMEIKPAGPNSGIFFNRSDLNKAQIVRADYESVVDTRYGTTISNSIGTKIHTVEHLMAAFMGIGLDNAEVVLSSCEVPVMDGSSKSFLKMLNSVGLKEQVSKRQSIKIIKEFAVFHEDKRISVSPADVLSIKYNIDFSDPAIGKQAREVVFSNGAFKEEISAARTFGFLNEVETLHKSGLALGGSLKNAIVVDDGKILNPEGLRYKDEFVRHKILDLCGDIYLAGKQIIGKIEANCAGHELNNTFLRRLLENKDNYDIVEQDEQIGHREFAIA